jgi:hypothetical protein
MLAGPFRPLIRRSAPISPTCPTACESCARHPGSRYGSRSSSPRSNAVTRHAAQRHHAQRLPAPAERPGNEMRGVDAGLGAHTMHGRPATAARCASLAAIESVRCNGVVRRRGLRARSWARRRGGVRFIGAPSRVGLVSCAGVPTRLRYAGVMTGDRRRPASAAAPGRRGDRRVRTRARRGISP